MAALLFVFFVCSHVFYGLVWGFFVDLIVLLIAGKLYVPPKHPKRSGRKKNRDFPLRTIPFLLILSGTGLLYSFWLKDRLGDLMATMLICGFVGFVWFLDLRTRHWRKKGSR
jgi:hypothetical protein